MAVIKEIDKSNAEHGDLNDYMILQSLLFEFHSIEFQGECEYSKSIEAIDNYVSSFWIIRCKNRSLN